jgi:predicted transcriptional regulator
MATNIPYSQRGADYARNLAAPFLASAQAYRNRLAGYLTPEQLARDIADLYAPALEQAGQIGERATSVIQGTTSGILGGLANLPGMDANIAALSARAAGRESGSAQLTQAAIKNSVALATAIAQANAEARRAEQYRMDEDRALEAEAEAGRVAANYLPYAQAMSGLDTEQLNRSLLRAELKNMPIQRKALRLQNMIASGEIQVAALRSAGMREELKNLGFTDNQIKNIIKKATPPPTPALTPVSPPVRPTG